MIGLAQIAGDVGKGIRVGQWLNGDGFSIWEHAFVLLPNNLILEAEPGGAVIVPMHYDEVYWCRGIDKLIAPTVTPDEISRVAESLKGIPYSFLDYQSLVVHRLHLPVPGLEKYIRSTGHMICSQMCDELYNRIGAHIFVDDRWPGDVTPGSLYGRDLELRLSTQGVS